MQVMQQQLQLLQMANATTACPALMPSTYIETSIFPQYFGQLHAAAYHTAAIMIMPQTHAVQGQLN